MKLLCGVKLLAMMDDEGLFSEAAVFESPIQLNRFTKNIKNSFSLPPPRNSLFHKVEFEWNIFLGLLFGALPGVKNLFLPS